MTGLLVQVSSKEVALWRPLGCKQPKHTGVGEESGPLDGTVPLCFRPELPFLGRPRAGSQAAKHPARRLLQWGSSGLGGTARVNNRHHDADHTTGPAQMPCQRGIYASPHSLQCCTKWPEQSVGRCCAMLSTWCTARVGLTSPPGMIRVTFDDEKNSRRSTGHAMDLRHRRLLDLGLHLLRMRHLEVAGIRVV